MADDVACCAHLTVEFRTTQVDGGTAVVGHWNCTTCGREFVAAGVSLSRQIASLRRELAESEATRKRLYVRLGHLRDERANLRAALGSLLSEEQG